MPRLGSAHVIQKRASQQFNYCCSSALDFCHCDKWDLLQALQPHIAQKNKPALNQIDAN